MDKIELLSWKDFTAGWISGVCYITLGHPLETMKVRQQTSKHASSIFKYSLVMLQKEGIGSFFRGMSYPLMTTGIINSLYFGFYANSLRMIEDAKGQDHFKNCCEGGSVYQGWHLDSFVAGCIGGFASTVVNIPIELVKTILQSEAGTQGIKTENKKSALTPRACLKSLYHREGVRGLFYGSTIMMIRDVPTFGLYAVCYEHLYCLLKDKNSSSGFLKAVNEGIAGGLSGVITWVLALPLDVVKSKLMSDFGENGPRKYSGIIDCVATTYRGTGIRGFYKGIWLAIARAFPVNLCCFVAYEQMLRILK